jgi:hypothetical protein
VDAILLEIDRRREELMGNVVQVVASRREDGRPEGVPAAGAGAESAGGSARSTPRTVPISEL